MKIIKIVDKSKLNDKVKIIFAPISKEDVINRVSRKVPVVTTLNSKIFSEGKILDEQHLIVISGITGEYFALASIVCFHKSIDIVFLAMKHAKAPLYISVEKG